jgi:hypothetical protein
VRFGAVWCAPPRVGNPFTGVASHQPRLKKSKVLVKFSTRDVPSAGVIKSPAPVLRSAFVRAIALWEKAVGEGGINPPEKTDHTDFHAGFGPVLRPEVHFRSFGNQK